MPGTKRGPLIRYARDGLPTVVIETPPDTDPFKLLEFCFGKHGVTITPESAARHDALMREISSREKEWLQEKKKRKGRR